MSEGRVRPVRVFGEVARCRALGTDVVAGALQSFNQAACGFAGQRVIQQTVRETLPEGFQRSEFLLEHGVLDMIVDRRDMRDRISAALRILLKLPPAVVPPAAAA